MNPLAPPWSEHPVLVTGATGLLGGWLTARLVSLGADVTCVLRDAVQAAHVHRYAAQVRIVHGDVRDQALIERALSERAIRTVFHLAAQTQVQTARQNPTSTWDSNIRGTWTVLEAARRCPTIQAIVLASSDKAYGDHGGAVTDEAAAIQARAPYDVSKACADLIAQSYAATWNLPVCITRCGNLFGGGDLNWARLVPGVCRDLHAGRAPQLRSDGTAVRDWFYVEDAAAAYIALAEALLSGAVAPGQALNLSGHGPATVATVVDHLRSIAGAHQPSALLGTAHQELHAQRLNTNRARTLLSLPPPTDLREGLARTWAWYAAHLGQESP